MRRLMNRYPLVASVTSLALASVLLFTSLGFACSKDQLVAYAQDALDSMRAGQPYVNQLLPAKAQMFATAIVSAEKLVTAVKNSDKTEAVQLLASITPVFSEIAKDLGANESALAALALGDIGFHFLVNHLPLSKIAGAGPQVQKLAAFKKEERWGCKYHPEKCN